MKERSILHRVRPTDWIASALLVTYVIVFSWLTIRQHQSFNTRALDLGKFDQAIWNTAQGRPFQITLAEHTVLQSHFSPSLALYAPLYWIWPDIRLLFIAQSILSGTAGFLIYWFARKEDPWLALAVFAAYLMHPVLHQVNLVEFRRLTLAGFATSLVMFGMLRRRWGLMALGLALALLSKEDQALTAVAVGLYLIVIQRNRKVGLATLLTGLGWLLLVPFVILPALSPASSSLSRGYGQAGAYLSYLGKTPGSMVRNLIGNPGLLLRYAGHQERLAAVLRFVWPTAFLFLLAPEIAFLLLPHLGLLLLSTSDVLGELRGWYPTVLVPVLFWAVATGASRVPARWRRVAMAGLLLASAAGWLLYSPLWPGARFDSGRYQVTAHHRQVESALRQIPPGATVAAQDALLPHLSHREEIYLFPWIFGDFQTDYVVFDREMGTYPVPIEAYRTLFYDVLAGTEYELADQTGELYIFRHVATLSPQVSCWNTWGESLTLTGYSLAAALPDEAFQRNPEALPAGSTVRVSLFWRVEKQMGHNYSVFVHLLGADGRLLAEHDGWPADQHRPTSVLPAGETIRDVHYLTVLETVSAADLSLRIGVHGSLGVGPLSLPTGEEYVVLPAQR